MEGMGDTKEGEYAGEGAGARSRHTMCEARSEQMLLRVRDMHDAIRTGEAAGWQRSQGVMQCESD